MKMIKGILRKFGLRMEAEHKKELPESEPKRERVTCPECEGGGVVQDPLCSMSGCGGGMSCPTCSGTGSVWKEDV
jgi:Archaea-specific RecJ-like exonuclease, contains DnaJ-type Zn finger domain